MEFSMKNICRTCMNETNKMISVFSTVEDYMNDKTFADMLMACASVKVTEGDGLPELICRHCTKLLTVAFNFKKQSEQTDATLREITKNPAIEFIKVNLTDVDEFLETNSELDDIHKSDGDKDKLVELSENFLEDNSSDSDKIDVKSDLDNGEDIEKYDEEYIEDSMKEEILEEQSTKTDSFTCVTCFKTFAKFGHFIKHLNSHCVDSFHCEKCDIMFKTKYEFSRHKRCHVKPHKCELCGKEFRSSYGLLYHTKIHTGVKNYECSFEGCNKKFALKQALDKHVCVHSKNGNHLCYLCGKMYSTYDALHYHIKTHEGLRPHLCVYCGRTFKQACHLKSHMWIHNGIKPYDCKSCGKCYTSGHQLKKHLKKYCNNFMTENS